MAHDDRPADVSSPAPESAGPRDRSALLKRAAALRSSLHTLHAADSDAAQQLAELEHQLLELNAQAAAEDESDELAEHGHPVLDDAYDWLELARGYHQGADELSGVIHDLVRAEAAAAVEYAQPQNGRPDVRRAFDSLFELSTLELESFARCEEDQSDPQLGECRGELRQLLADGCRADPPRDPLRDQWASELTDRADVLRTAIDEVTPRVAVAELERGLDDLTWHEAQIEPKSGPRRSRLRRKISRLRSAWQDRVVQSRLEARFGRRAVTWFARLVLTMIALLLGLLTLRGMMVLGMVELTESTVYRLEILDTVACLILLWEFTYKWWIAPLRARWFRRYFLIELIPAIPFGLLVIVSAGESWIEAADSARLLLLMRWMQLPRLARYVILLRPLILTLRAIGLLFRGLDSIARSFGRLVNRNIILHPTEEERERELEQQSELSGRLQRLRGELNARWRGLLETSSNGERGAVVAARVSTLCRARDDGLGLRQRHGRLRLRSRRDLLADRLLRQMATLTAHEVETELGETLAARIAWSVRLLSRTPLRWLPILHACVPQTSPQMNNAEVTAATGRQVSALLQKYYDRWLWVADLHGTVTPSLFVDRMGTVLVRSTLRPVYRLLVFGGLYLLTRLVFRLASHLGFLDLFVEVERYLGRVVGQTLVVLGAICVVLLGIGWWLKRLAREATDFYERSAYAQFLHLTENIRPRQLERDAGILYRRVIQPELQVREAEDRSDQSEKQFLLRVRQSLLGTYWGDDAENGPDMMDRTVLLYRDWLDGALFTDNDNRATAQLLGNPALRQLQFASNRFTRRDAKELSKLDLDRQNQLLGGPYLWFNFISRAIAHEVARHIVEYNRNAIPLAELAQCTKSERIRYEQWLARRDIDPVIPNEAAAEQAEVDAVTTAFTAMHFLDVNVERDEQVAARFGEGVMDALRRDRSRLIRRIFGTYPAHKLPREQRVLNLYEFYQGWFAGGRAVLLPVWLAGLGLRLGRAFLRWLLNSVREIRRTGLSGGSVDAAEADFHTAVRKIHRMRGPAVEACIRLRATMDPEYLGIPLPGNEDETIEADAPFERDLDFLSENPTLFLDLYQERTRARADMDRLGALLADGLLAEAADRIDVPTESLSTPEHRRAAAVAYLGDLNGVRSHLSAGSILEELRDRTAREPVAPFTWWPAPLRRWRFRRWWSQHGRGDRLARKAMWRAICHNHNGGADALDAWARLGEKATEAGQRYLAELLRHPGRISEQMVSVRAVSTLAILDVLHYRQHVYLLGDYSLTSGVAPNLLRLEA